MNDSIAIHMRRIKELERQLSLALKRINQLEEKIDKLEKENIELKMENAQLKSQIYGKSKKKDKDDSDYDNDNSSGDCGNADFVSLRNKKVDKKKRDAKSYRRQIPGEEEITDKKEYPIGCCPDCGGVLGKRGYLERWIEDIPAFIDQIRKTVTYELIHSGYCNKCNKRHYGKNMEDMNIKGQQVVIGNNVKPLILYCIYIMNLSWQNAINLIYDLYDLKISDGEIANVLEEAADKLGEEHLRIRKEIRGSPVSHMDETYWRMMALKYFGWVWVPGDGGEISIEVRNTRGKGVAEEMIGDDFDNLLVTDFYPAYKNLAKEKNRNGEHGTCWVHLLRDFEDLAKNKYVPKRLKKHCYNRYAQACEFYHELCEELEKPFDLDERKKVCKKFQIKLLKWAKVSANDDKLKKLRNLKLRIQKYIDELTVYLLHPNASPHNNKAEQAVRHLVIKRKISHGSRSDSGCKILSTNLSVLLTHWRCQRDNFFRIISSLLGFAG